MTHNFKDTIVAPISPAGKGAVSLIRISGGKSIEIIESIFKGKKLSLQKSHTVHFGEIVDRSNKKEIVLDEVLVTIFKAPSSFTKEDTIEIACHGSEYIVQKIIWLILTKGARLAKPGEFTQRAYLNGRFDLAQAEAVADLIAADSELSHRTALQQMKGGFSDEIKSLRQQLINFASLIELELDFFEEDIEFANRTSLTKLIVQIQDNINNLIQSFQLGNVIKKGINTAIIGKPNAGKSTLLNTLLNEDRAIVSDIPGTTRDTIEATINIQGILFKIIDTAGIRKAQDAIEAIGVERTHKAIEEASIILYLFDLENYDAEEIMLSLQSMQKTHHKIILVGNKVDKVENNDDFFGSQYQLIRLSAKENKGVDTLREILYKAAIGTQNIDNNTIVTNSRHYESLQLTSQSLERVLVGIDTGISSDFLALDIREALRYLGEITGEITNDDILGNIFSKFCIGK